MTIAQMRDTLAEARRYATSAPDAALSLAMDVADATRRRAVHGERPKSLTLYRLTRNLEEACGAIRVDPEVFTSYCYAVSHELLSIKGD